MTNYQASLEILNKTKLIMMTHYRVSFPYFLYRYVLKITTLNLKGGNIHTITTNTEPRWQLMTMQKPGSWWCTNLIGPRPFLNLRSLTPHARGNSNDIWIPIFWRNVYLATEYKLKGAITAAVSLHFLSSFVVPIWNAMINTDMEHVHCLEATCFSNGHTPSALK